MKEKIESGQEKKEKKISNLVLLNYNINDGSYTIIISSLIEISKVEFSVAVDITLDAYNRGKAVIKSDIVDNLLPMHKAFEKKNITTAIE